MERSTVVQDISQQVTCGICLEHFKTPKTVIPCLHNFCEVCLQDMIASTAQPKIGTPPDSQFFTFSCPTCRGVVEFPVKFPQPWDMKQIARDAVKLEFKTNFQIENQLEIINKKIEKGCPQHQGEVRMWYCKACHKVICQFCVQEDHNSDKHTVTLLNEIANEKRKGLSSHKEAVETRLCDLELTRAQMESQLEQIHSARTKYGHQKKKVTDEFLAIHKELDSLKSQVVTCVTRAQGKDFDLLSSNEMVILALFQEVLEQVDNYKTQLNEIDKRIADTDSELVEQSSDSVMRMLEEFAAEAPPRPPSVPKLEIPQIPEIPLDVLEHGMAEIKNILKKIADDLKLSPVATPKSVPSARHRAPLERWPQRERSFAEEADDDDKKGNDCLELEEIDLWHLSLFDEEDKDHYQHQEQEEEEEWESYQYQDEDKEDVESPWYSCHSSPSTSSPLQELDSTRTSATTAATLSVNQQPLLPALGTSASHGMNAQGSSNNTALMPSPVQQGTTTPDQMLFNPVNPQQIMHPQPLNLLRQQAVAGYMLNQAIQRGNLRSGIPMSNMSQTQQGGQLQATYQQNPPITMTAPTLVSCSHHSAPQSPQYVMQPQVMMTPPNLYNPRQQMQQIPHYQQRPAFQPVFQQPQQPHFYQGPPSGSVYQQPNVAPFYQGLPSSALTQQTNMTPFYQGSPGVSAPGGALYPQNQTAITATQQPLLRQPAPAVTTSQVQQHPTSTTDSTWTHQGPSSASSLTPLCQEPLTAHMLARASKNEQKQMLGERLYTIIHQMHGDLAGKITGMLLEMDNAQLLHLLESRDTLIAKVEEALEVIKFHTRKV